MFVRALPTMVAGLVSLLAVNGSAQRVLHKNVGADYYLNHGASVAAAGDVSGDGAEDYWMAGRSFQVDGEVSVYLVSGADGVTLLQIDTGVSILESYPTLALAGGRDLSGDGVPDVVIGMPQADGLATGSGLVQIRSGVDGALLREKRGQATGDRYGESVAFSDDFDGDGVDDFGIGVPGDDEQGVDRGSVRAVSGASGQTFAILRGDWAGDQFGSALASAGDVNGDGKDDLLVGASHAEGNYLDSGLVTLLSGANGAHLATYYGDAAGDLFGHAVAGAGDVNNDGVPDVIVGAPGGRLARVFSGADGSTLWDVTRTSSPSTWHPVYFGWAVAGIGDQNGDGFDDFAVGYPLYSGVWMFSGADAAVLARYSAAYLGSGGGSGSCDLGYSLAPLSDLTGDGRLELAVGAPLDLIGSNNTGSVVVLSGIVEPEWLYEGETALSAISGAGDIDGDGCDDLAYGKGAPGPTLVILSGRNRSVLRTLPANVGRLARAGDVNADGVEDLLMEGYTQGSQGIFVISGANGAVLHQFDWFSSDRAFAGVGDINGDGHDDVAWPAYSGMEVASGSDWTTLLLLSEEAYTPSCFTPGYEGFGFSVTGVGDWDRDGTPDLAVGAPQGGDNGGGEVRVFSGASGALLQEFSGGEPCEGWLAFGISISGAPDFDVDADGYVDLVVGAQHVNTYGAGAAWGSAAVFSSRTGTTIGSWWAGSTEGYGFRRVGPAYSVTVAGDFNGDGHSDFAVSDPTEPSLLGPGAGQVVVVSGLDNTVIAEIHGTSSWDYLGYHLTAAGDTNGDGLSDVFVHRRPGSTFDSGGDSSPDAVAGAIVLQGHPDKKPRGNSTRRTSGL